MVIALGTGAGGNVTSTAGTTGGTTGCPGGRGASGRPCRTLDVETCLNINGGLDVDNILDVERWFLEVDRWPAEVELYLDVEW